jgi:hypothetical protein
MPLTKTQKYIAVSLSVIITFIASFMILKMYNQNVYIAFLPTILVGVSGIGSILQHKDNDSENYEVESSGCNQTINITQNCADKNPSPKPKPTPVPPPSNLSDKIKKWIMSLNSKLTSECQSCILENALKMWKEDTLSKVLDMDNESQNKVLNGLLAFDCSKQCVIPQTGLNKSAVDTWARSTLKGVSNDCVECVVDSAMKLWSPDDYKKVLSKTPEEQMKIAEGVLALHCEKCKQNPNKLDPNMVKSWLSSLLVGAKPDCYNCAVETIVKLWEQKDFIKVKSMEKKSQVQVVQALLGLNCEKSCVVVPSGLNPRDVEAWLLKTSPLEFQSKDCLNCTVASIVKLWTPENMKTVMGKSRLDASKIIQGVVAMNCKTQCLNSPLSRARVVDWFKEKLPGQNINCLNCVVDKAVEEWKTNTLFVEKVLSLSPKDQSKLARTFADYNCSHICNVEPFDSCHLDV